MDFRGEPAGRDPADWFIDDEPPLGAQMQDLDKLIQEDGCKLVVAYEQCFEAYLIDPDGKRMTVNEGFGTSALSAVDDFLRAYGVRR